MANAKMCDRCGAYYPPYTAGDNLPNGVDLMSLGPAYSLNSDKLIRRFELCPACARFVYELVTAPAREVEKMHEQ